MAGPYKAVFTWSFDDFNVLCDAYMRLTPGRRRARVVHYVIDGLLLVFMIGLAIGGQWMVAAYFGFLLVLLLLLEFVVGPWQRRRQFRNQYLGEGEVSITADIEGLHLVSPVGEGRHLWDGIRHVDVLAEHIILWPNNRLGFLVPKRAFASPDEADGFAKLAKEKTRGQTF